MAKEWIEALAQQIKEKSRGPAEEFGRQQRRDGLILRDGKVFFEDLERCLEDVFGQIRKLLQGDPSSAEITIVKTGATEVRLTRERFPWFDAHITHKVDTILLEYAKDEGVVLEPSLIPRQTITFRFKVDETERLSAAEDEHEFASAEDLAERITAVLLQV